MSPAIWQRPGTHKHRQMDRSLHLRLRVVNVKDDVAAGRRGNMNERLKSEQVELKFVVAMLRRPEIQSNG